VPTPVKGYKNAAGRRIPGTTTIINRFKDSSALVRWAWKKGLNSESIDREKDDAADVGTLVHAKIEEHYKGIKAKIDTEHFTEEQHAQADSALFAFFSWIENFKARIVETEIHLVDEEWQYGGTPDAVAWVGSELCLLDWKTSNGVYADHLVQLAAYRNLWAVNRPNQPLTGGSHLLRFSKDNGDFAHHYFPNLDEAWEQFKLFRAAYDIDLKLKKRAA
jgi:hypothetical protein